MVEVFFCFRVLLHNGVTDYSKSAVCSDKSQNWDLCGKCFKKRMMWRDMRQGITERNACELCDKTFTNTEAFKGHKHTHGGIAYWYVFSLVGTSSWLPQSEVEGWE